MNICSLPLFGSHLVVVKEEDKTLIAIVPLREPFLPTDDILSLWVGVTALGLKVRPIEPQLVSLEDHKLPFSC